MTSSQLHPDWLSPPGATVTVAMRRRGLSSTTLQGRCGLTAQAFEGLLDGRLVISRELAEELARNLGASAEFWLARERLYRNRLESTGVSIEQLASSVPFAEMRRLGWLRDLDHLPREEALRRFYADAADDPAVGTQLIEAVRFRMSVAHPVEPGPVAAWLRQGVRQARKLKCATLDRSRLKEAIPKNRALTRVKSPGAFLPRLVEICAAAGVAVVFVRTPRGCPASGATHYDGDHAILQLSFRYRSDDHLWFTVFHEIGHIILHGYSKVFIEGQGFDHASEEAEANDYSARILISKDDESALAALRPDFRAIMRFARRIGVSSGVIVGQMQKRNLLRHNQLNFLKVRYDWSDLGEFSL